MVLYRNLYFIPINRTCYDMIFARLLKLFSSENRSGRAGQGRAAAGQGRTMGFLLLLIFLAAQCWLVQTLNESTA